MDDTILESSYNSKVKNLVVAYEHYKPEPVEENLRPRSKSIGNILTYKHFRKQKFEIRNIIDIEKELVKIDTHLNYYEFYDKDTHVAFQEQLFEILRAIVSINTNDDSTEKRRELIEETQKLAKILNAKLPTDNAHKTASYKNRNNYNRVDSGVVSSTSVKNHVNNSVNVSTTNVDYNSTDQIDSTANSSLVDQNHTTARPIKLSRFYSFNKETKPDDQNVIPPVYSSLSRTVSLNNKNNHKYLFYKQFSQNIDKDKNGSFIQHEIDHARSKLNGNSTAAEKSNIAKLDLYEEPIREDLETSNKLEALSVSVSDLKNFFEEKRQDKVGQDTIIRKQSKLSKTFSYSKHDDLSFRKLNNNYLNETPHNGDNSGKYHSENHVINETPLGKSNNILNEDDVKETNEQALIESVSGQVKTLRETFENIDESKHFAAPKDKNTTFTQIIQPQIKTLSTPAENCQQEQNSIAENPIHTNNNQDTAEQYHQINRDIRLKEPIQLQISNYLNGINKSSSSSIDVGNEKQIKLEKAIEIPGPALKASSIQSIPEEYVTLLNDNDAAGNEAKSKKSIETSTPLNSSTSDESATALSPAGLENATVNGKKECLLRVEIQPKTASASAVYSADRGNDEEQMEEVKTPTNNINNVDEGIQYASAEMTPVSKATYNSILSKSEESLLDKIDPESGLDYYHDRFEEMVSDCNMENTNDEFENVVKENLQK